MKLPSDIAAAVVATATRRGLDPCLLAALVMQESAGKRRATRYEAHYRWVWDTLNRKPFRRLTDAEARSDAPPPDFHGPAGAVSQDEWCGQRTSWGICQVMGAVARELGYEDPSFYGLWDVDTNLELGAKLLEKLLRRWELSDALSAYNAGAPTEKNEATYVRPVLRMAEEFRREGL